MTGVKMVHRYSYVDLTALCTGGVRGSKEVDSRDELVSQLPRTLLTPELALPLWNHLNRPSLKLNKMISASIDFNLNTTNVRVITDLLLRSFVDWVFVD